MSGLLLWLAGPHKRDRAGTEHSWIGTRHVYQPFFRGCQLTTNLKAKLSGRSNCQLSVQQTRAPCSRALRHIDTCRSPGSISASPSCQASRQGRQLHRPRLGNHATSRTTTRKPRSSWPSSPSIQTANVSTFDFTSDDAAPKLPPQKRLYRMKTIPPQFDRPVLQAFRGRALRPACDVDEASQRTCTGVRAARSASLSRRGRKYRITIADQEADERDGVVGGGAVHHRGGMG